LSRLQLEVMVPDKYDKARVADIVRALCSQVSNLSEGRLSARYYNATVIPSATAMPGAVGDIVWDSNTTVRGSVAPGVAASYVRLGWVCTVSGAPGTWQEMRVLTGA
jgi:hypothetical protein